MTWTYSTAQTTNRDKLRFMMGDTDDTRHLLEDEELDAILTRHSNNLIASAIEIADALEARFVRRAESRSGDIIADFLTVAGKYRELANRLRKKNVKGIQILTTAERIADKEQCTYPAPSIQRDEWDYHGLPE